jgi:DNA-binding LacI/PurR family transcriptional regulator
MRFWLQTSVLTVRSFNDKVFAHIQHSEVTVVKPRRRPVTLAVIADDLGTTRMAVSKALRGHKDIGAETRRRVLARARELNYQANLYRIFRRVSERGVPLVLAGRRLDNVETSYVSADNFAVGLVATDHLLAQGRRRIADLRGPEDSTSLLPCKGVWETFVIPASSRCL